MCLDATYLFNQVFRYFSFGLILISNGSYIFRLLKYSHLLHTIYHGQAGDRKLLLHVIPMVWNDSSVLIKSSAAARSPLLRKYLVKLTQRIGLTCLPYRSSSWRYVVSRAKDFVILIQKPYFS